MQNLKDLEQLIKSSVPVIIIETKEENRLMGMFNHLLSYITKPMYRWSVTEGLKRIDVDMPAQYHNNKPVELLTQVKMTSLGGIYLLLDFHPYFDEPVIVRLLKDIAQMHVDVPHTLVLISHELKIPNELETYCVRFDLSLPDRDKIETIIRQEAKTWSNMNQNLRIVVDKRVLNQIIDGLMGLPADDVTRLVRNAIRQDGVLTESDVASIMQEKFKLLSQGGVLSFEYDTGRFADVGGLKKLKNWLDLRKETFSGGVNIPGLDPPKGILMLGVQGCGKSLAAKAVAGSWGVPLLRLDFGSLYNKYHGETERNLRESLKSAEIMSPCILWIDEIEKGIATSDSDGGTSKRVLGTLLTWMAEKNKKIFLVATANDIQALPPELLRKGRFDEIFFVDLPDQESRETILTIHLKKRDQDPGKFDIKKLAEMCDGFSGAEIEQAVVSALYRSFARKAKLTDAEIIEEMEMTRPLSVVMAEKVEALREWAKERTVMAN
jgi:SpoVK/Ycf46/Vps4 family AAA+-type ATPase